MNPVLIIAIFVSIIIESTIITFPLTLTVILMATLVSGTFMTVWAFVAGLVLDIFQLKPLGVDSLFFLGFGWVWSRYGKKFHAGQIWYQIIFLIAVLIPYSLLFYRNLDPFRFLLTAGIIIGLFFLLKKYFPETGSKRKLSL